MRAPIRFLHTMKNILIAAGLVSITSIIEAFALYNIRFGGFTHTAIASLIYGLGVVPMLSKTIVYEGIGIVNFLWNIMSTLFGFGIGIYLFKEEVHYLQVMGAIVSMAGIGMILLVPKKIKN
jgi:multidrug transporter EmrE-like cation transporter